MWWTLCLINQCKRKQNCNLEHNFFIKHELFDDNSCFIVEIALNTRICRHVIARQSSLLWRSTLPTLYNKLEGYSDDVWDQVFWHGSVYRLFALVEIVEVWFSSVVVDTVRFTIPNEHVFKTVIATVKANHTRADTSWELDSQQNGNINRFRSAWQIHEIRSLFWHFENAVIIVFIKAKYNRLFFSIFYTYKKLKNRIFRFPLLMNILYTKSSNVYWLITDENEPTFLSFFWRKRMLAVVVCS